MHALDLVSSQPQSLIALSEDKDFLRHNLGNILATDCPSYCRYVYVENGVATVTNGRSITVRYLLQAPDGFYALNHQGLLAPTQYADRWGGYPHPMSFIPTGAELETSGMLSNEFAKDFVIWCSRVRETKRPVFFDKREIFVPNTDYRVDLTSIMDGQLPVGDDVLQFSAYDLQLAFTEMMRYSHFYISRAKSKDSVMPLVLGHNWNQCAMLMPRQMYH